MLQLLATWRFCKQFFSIQTILFTDFFKFGTNKLVCDKQPKLDDTTILSIKHDKNMGLKFPALATLLSSDLYFLAIDFAKYSTDNSITHAVVANLNKSHLQCSVYPSVRHSY